MPSGALSPLLRRLTEEKRVLAVDTPLSTRPGKPARYRVADSNLRLYLAALRSAQELTRRGRPEAAFHLVQRRWTTWRGRAVEPLVRESLEISALAGALPWPEAEAVGGWWNRQFSPEIDLIGADCSPVAHRLFVAGSIKWLASPFDQHDLSALRHSTTPLPGYDPGATGLIVASLSGTDAHLDATAISLIWGPTDIVAAWQT
ncbi:DUF234 domain-containing protein [Streptomyces sp. ACA25]|uniref:DUF234 domain-containing protein n=1 Tax=Streptomyces sp. ACA25 TaxID=3022596 RepID=UPI002307A1F5|nr:DUF234 domain-containing protein [Streptomyces sp. ACA25]MDB1087099.1 DUF234 domain-containing protein [Streptomyces sp. ACA25]